jgi:hypothetical protein
LYLQHLHVRAFFLPASIFVLATLGLVVYYSLYKFSDLWINMNLASGNAFHFCETDRMDQLIRQPANTWSNLAYFLVGLFALTLGVQDFKQSGRKESDNFLVRYPIFSIMFGLSVVYVFFGSFLYHASLTSYFQKIDQTGLYSTIIIVLVFNIYKIFPVFRFRQQWKSSHALMVGLIFLFNYIIFTHLWTININLLFPTLVVMVFITSAYYTLFINKEHYFTNYLWAASAIMVLAGIIWILDRTDVVCSPDSIFQGHALWHILTAVSLLFIYMYYRSGTVPLQSVIEMKEHRRAMRGQG